MGQEDYAVFNAEGYRFALPALPVIIAGLGMIALGIAVAVREGRSPITLAFGFLTLAVALWLLGYAVVYSVTDAALALTWIRIVAHLGVIALPSALLLFTLHATARFRELRRVAAVSLAISALFYAADVATDWFVAGTYSYEWGHYARYGPLGPAFLVFFIGCLLGSLFLLWQAYLAAPSGTRRKRLGSLLIAFVIGSAGSVDFLPAVGVPLYPMGHLPVLCFVWLAGRAIWRYRLVDITPGFALREILDTMTEAVVLIDRDGIIRVANKAARSQFGSGDSRLTGKHYAGVIPQAPVLDQAWDSTPLSHDSAKGERAGARVATHGQRYEIVQDRAGSERRYLSASVAAKRSRSGEPLALVCVFEDITERRQAEEALKETNRQLAQTVDQLTRTQREVIQQERLRALGQMASGIAHGLNNALSPILSFSELLLMRPEKIANNQQTLATMQTIYEAAIDARNIVARLSDFYRERPSDGTLGPIDLNTVVQEAVMMSQPRWKAQALAKGAVIEVKTELQPVPVIAGDETDLREALVNLLFNAVDALPAGGTITVRTRSDGQRVFVDVEDTGVGMTEEVRRRAMEPFFSTKGMEGTGLGLPLVYGAVTRHGGGMDIVSAPGKGTRVALTIPVREASALSAELNQAGPFERSLRVLLVDDDSVVHTAVREYLLLDGHAVDSVSSTSEAMELFNRGTYDVVLTDWAMPGVSGDQLGLAVKQLSPRTPVIMVTGFADTGLVPGLESAGVDAVIRKPVTLADLRRTLARVLGDKDVLAGKDVLAS